jgi:uncharacterized peroxidase-related enzyme
MGIVPNMYRMMAHAPALLETYMDGYTRFRESSGFTPVEQEVVFLAISRENACEYCMAAHSTVADVLTRVPGEVTAALRDDRPIDDARLAALARFARALVATRGRPTTEDAEAFLDAGFSPAQIMHVLLAVAVKTMSNYANHMARTPIDPMFAARAWSPPT